MGTGGEILNYTKNGGGKPPLNLDENLIRVFGMIPYVKILIYFLIILLGFIVLMRMFKIKSPFKGKAVKGQVAHLEAIRKRDAQIVRVNRFIVELTDLVERSPFGMNKGHLDYWDYNVERAGVKDPTGTRKLNAKEFHAFIILAQFVGFAVSVFVIVLVNALLGWVMVLMVLMLLNYMPMAVVRQMVKAKDGEIKKHFSDFYLMIHYVLLEGTSTPLSSVMKSFDKTTESEEMHRFIDVCLHNIDTYGEYEATRFIAKQYREIPEVSKLMRLIRQANQGGDIKMDLNGFRAELIKEKRYEITKKTDKLIKRAKASFNILTVVLVQAILSAMSIYLPDLGIMKSFLG